MIDYQEARKEMVKNQIKGRGLSNELVLEAMLAVPREQFVSDSYKEKAYEDRALPTEEGQTISQPYIVAVMINALNPVKLKGVYLEVGAGTGYSAAVLGKIVEHVYSIERSKKLFREAKKRIQDLHYDNVTILEGDGSLGLPEKAPFDGIVVAAGGPELPLALMKQLKIGAKLLMPVGSEKRFQSLVAVTRTSELEYKQETLGSVQFVPLIGAQGWQEAKES